MAKNNEQVKEVQKDVDNFSALVQLKDSEGGKVLIATYADDILTTITILSGGYKKLPHPELIAHCASLAEKLEVLRTLTRSSKNLDGAKEELTRLLTEDDS